jgi:hypothetical protein
VEATSTDQADYATPEAMEATRRALDLVLEVREEQIEPLERKIAIYERSLGLAVIPVLVRRAWIVFRRTRRERRLGGR